MNTERFNADERGVSEIVGAILVFALVVMLISIMQTVAVPNQNQEIEVQHSVDVQGDMAKYHQVASEVATSGSEQSVAIQTGTGYPARLLFFNPPRVQGTLETSEQGTVEIENIEYTQDEADESISGNQLALESRTMQYRGNYNEYQDPPVTKYEYGILYNEYDDASVVANPGTLIDGTDINLLFLAGEYAQTSSTTQSVGVQPVSAPARSVSIRTADSTNPLRIELPSDLPEERWEDEYESQSQSPTNNVEDIFKPDPDTVVILLDSDKTYDLRMSRIALEKDVQKPDGYYIVPAGDGTASVSEGSTTNVKFEVRDEYNNPVSDVEVKVESPTGDEEFQTTNSDGKITVPITPDSSGTQTARAYIQEQSNVDGCDTSPKADRCKADFTLQVTDLSINPNSGVKLEEVTIQTEEVRIELPNDQGVDTPVTQNTEVIEAEFNSTDGTKRIAELRVNVYAAAQQENEEPAPDQVQIKNTDPSNVALSGVNVSGPFYSSGDDEWENGPQKIEETDNQKYQFAFRQAGGDTRNAESGDFFVLTVVFQDREQAVYFVSPD